MTTPREEARARALRTARAVTLGLVVGAGSAGCDLVVDQGCRVFDRTQYCCERRGDYWDPYAHTCTTPIPVPGPFVPPAERA